MIVRVDKMQLLDSQDVYNIDIFVHSYGIEQHHQAVQPPQ